MFLRSEFKGQLPKAYSHFENATQLIDNHFNDANKEEMDRYVSFIQLLKYNFLFVKTL